jgi:growth factor-regulated tyrosine kinase substrate
MLYYGEQSKDCVSVAFPRLCRYADNISRDSDAKKAGAMHHHHYSSSASKPTPSSHQRHTAHEQGDDDLQRAIQLSLEEAGLVHGPRRADYVPQTPSYEISEPPLIYGGSAAIEAGEDDPDLRAAIEASLREANAPKPSAPIVEDGQPYAHSPAPYEPSASHVEVRVI